MTSTTMTLSALTPAYLTARVRVAAARQAVKNAEGRPEMMRAKNADHAAEVAEIRRESRYPGGPRFLTAAQALARGSGSGYEIVYKRCSTHDDHKCEHDPTDPPFTDDKIAEAEKQITAAKRALAKAGKRLAEEPPDFDVIGSAQQAGSRFVWWPPNRFADPTKQRYQGQPITDDELAELGVFELQRQVNLGQIVEIPT